MSGDSPRISVIIPCYNAEAFLQRTLDSVLAQTVAPHEIIIVDDGSGDKSASIAANNPHPVRLIRQENSGVCAARNRALSAVTGEWVALLDADDLWEPTKLERQIAALRSTPAAVCCHTHYYVFDDHGREELTPRGAISDSEDFRVELLCEALVIPSSAIVRADVATRIGFRLDVKQCEDMIFFLELREHGPFVKVEAPLVGYRRHPGQYTAGYKHEFKGVLTRFRWFEEHSANYTSEQQTAVRAKLAYQLLWPHAQAILAIDSGTESDIRQAYRQVAPPNRPVPRAMRDELICVLETRLKRWLWFRVFEKLPWLAATYHAVRGRSNTA